jgi:hypothetical protein
MSRAKTPQDEHEPTISKAKVKITSGSPRLESRPIAEIEVKPNEQPHMSLGSFTDGNLPKGYVIELSPDPEPPESVVTQIMQVGTHENFDLILHIANYGNRTISAEVHQL